MGNVELLECLENDETVSELSFLMACEELSAANHITVARLFNESVHLL